jgi:alpha-1,2-mannosyltransferase
VRSVLASPPSSAESTKHHGNRLLVAGIAAFVVAFGGWLAYLAIHPEDWTLNMIDLSVYRAGGLITRHVTHEGVKHISYYYNGHLASPLYDWTRNGKDSLQFTYTPFAAVSFALVSFLSTGVATPVDTVLNFLALMAAIWFTLGGLASQNGHSRDRRAKIGAMLLGTAAVIWTEPVFRTIYLGQINLILMAAILWDLCQPDERRNKGLATGIAAGIKLVPLIFIPYLLITRKFRQAALAAAGFVATLLVGFAVLPKDSSKYWFGGLFAQGGRTGFTGWLGNQSLDGIITRLAGSINAAKPIWIVGSVIVVAAGLYCAMLLYRAGHTLPAILLTALTGDLVSPISWDHHWVWIAPGVVVAAYYAVKAWQAGRKQAAAAYTAAVVAILALFAAWPGALWGQRMNDHNTFYLGIIWNPPNSNPFQTYYKYGDQPWYVEYHWHGFQLLTGNAYILGGMAVFLCLVLIAVTSTGAPRER